MRVFEGYLERLTEVVDGWIRRVAMSLGLVLAMVALGFFVGEPGAFGQEKSGNSAKVKGPVFKVQTVAQGLDLPWGIDFLPGGDALVTERDSGRLLRVSPSGDVETVQQISEADGEGEGGLLGVAISPNYQKDGYVYIYYSTPQDNRVARMKLGEDPEPILTGIPVNSNHNGGRLAFGPGGLLYIGTGDAGNKPSAQNRKALSGKILRINPNGNIPKSNPFGNAVYSYGHRNVQGLTWDAKGRMYAAELGQNRFDEVNRIKKGANYGWPNVEGKGGPSRFQQPLTTFTTDNGSPSGAAIYKSPKIKAWQGNLFVAALRGQRLFRITLNKSGGFERKTFLFKERFGRIRAVEPAPGGSLWVMTSNGGNQDRILRLVAS